jgi:hypothetical protein
MSASETPSAKAARLYREGVTNLGVLAQQLKKPSSTIRGWLIDAGLLGVAEGRPRVGEPVKDIRWTSAADAAQDARDAARISANDARVSKLEDEREERHLRDQLIGQTVRALCRAGEIVTIAQTPSGAYRVRGSEASNTATDADLLKALSALIRRKG